MLPQQPPQSGKLLPTPLMRITPPYKSALLLVFLLLVCKSHNLALCQSSFQEDTSIEPFRIFLIAISDKLSLELKWHHQRGKHHRLRKASIGIAVLNSPADFPKWSTASSAVQVFKYLRSP